MVEPVRGPWRIEEAKQPAMAPRICLPFTHRWTAGQAGTFRQRLQCSRCGLVKERFVV